MRIKTLKNSSLLRALCGYAILLMMATWSLPANAAVPIPFKCTGEAFTVRDGPSTLFQIDQETTPFLFNQIGPTAQTGPFGPDGSVIPIGLNNMGYRITDNLLYAVVLTRVDGLTVNRGIVQIDSAGNLFPIPNGDFDGEPLPDIPFMAGDVSTDGSKFYITRSPQGSFGTFDGRRMYTVDFDQDPPFISSIPIIPPIDHPIISVADWAAHPVTGILYGAAHRFTPISGTAAIYKLNPNTGVITLEGSAAGVPSGGLAYGGAWFNSAGRLFVYKNIDEIYEISLTIPNDPILITTQPGGAGVSNNNDAAACASVDPDAEVQGCTPGYWKQPQHLDSWAIFSPDDLFEDIFGVDLTGALDGLTLLEALSLKGGKENSLIRHATAALLNASSSVIYLFSPQEIIALVQDAYLTGDFNEAKSQLEDQNEIGCPLN